MLAALVFSGLVHGAETDASGQPPGEAARDLPLFDAHVHYKAEAWAPYPEATVIELMDRSGVAMALVSSTPDEGTIRLLEFAPERIVPELRPYHGEWGSRNWTKSPGMLDYLRQRISQYPHQGIGEFHIHQLDAADTDLLQQVAVLAREHEVPIHLHADAEPVTFFYGLDPNLIIIWAHVGMIEGPPKIREMMARHATLYADTSYREQDILGRDGTIDPAWRALFEDYPGRFMIGSDTWSNSQWARYGELIDTNRRWLAQLPRDVAEQIAYRNAERLFGRKVAMPPATN
jgi:predicted TIM-barrel fold metal-dependent hydrolase